MVRWSLCSNFMCYLFFEKNIFCFILLEVIWTLITTPAYWEAMTSLWRNFYVGQLLTFGNPTYCSNSINYPGWTVFPKTYNMFFFFFSFFLMTPHLVEYSVINTITANKLMDVGINVKKYTHYSWWDCFFITSPATWKFYCCIV